MPERQGVGDLNGGAACEDARERCAPRASTLSPLLLPRKLHACHKAVTPLAISKSPELVGNDFFSQGVGLCLLMLCRPLK